MPRKLTEISADIARLEEQINFYVSDKDWDAVCSTARAIQDLEFEYECSRGD